MPLTPTTTSSMGRVTCDSTSDGEAPGYGTLMATTGKLTSGNRSVPRREKPTAPRTKKPSVTITTKTGRRMAMADRPMLLSSRPLITWSPARR